jgi:hypothetical protein
MMQSLRSSGSHADRPDADLTAEFDADDYRHERYLGTSRRSRALTGYYAVKPLIPRGIQLALRRRYARRQAARAFPAWPIEPVLVNASHAEIRERLRTSAAAAIPLVGYWPRPYRAASVLTHDVEGPEGISNIGRILEIERRHGLVSSWNFVAEDYPIPEGVFDLIRAAGGEIGLHGIKHDGKLFQSRARFEADLPKIHAYMARWDAVGFRSPATHRRAEWMHELGCLYDSSFPDTDPFEPQPGGCCSILPFMFGDVVELPLTLVQDHTLWEILQHKSIRLWREKATWIIANHGLVNVNTHPDYFTGPRRLEMYDEFLAFLASQPNCWRALPREVAAWWRARAPLRCDADNTGRIEGDHDGRAGIWLARELDGTISFETASDVHASIFA